MADLVIAPSEQVTTPLHLLQLALEKDSNIDVIERIARMQREEREYQATVDFNEALNRCQSKMRRIAADATNPQTHSKYATYAALDRVLRPIYSDEGFSISFSEDEASGADVLKVIGYLSREGHTRTYRKTMPVDTKGPKGNDVMTKTHAAGSAGSYAKRYLLKDIFNVAVGEDDDDGNGGSANPEHETIIAESCAVIAGSEAESDLRTNFTQRFSVAEKQRDKVAMARYTEARDIRRKQLDPTEWEKLLNACGTVEAFNERVIPECKVRPRWFTERAAAVAKARGWAANKETKLFEVQA